MAVAMAFVGVSAGAGVTPASATNSSGAANRQANCTINQDGGVNMQDPNPHTFYYSDLDSNTQLHVDWARRDVLERTSIDTSVVPEVTSLTDVVVYDQDYLYYCGYDWHGPQNVSGVGTVGAVTCVSLAAGGKCEKHEVRMDLSWWLHAEVTNLERRSVACHENGHTVGLTHVDDHPGISDQNSCMQSVSGARDYISEHDVIHLNNGGSGWYGSGSWRLVPGVGWMPWEVIENHYLSSWNGRFKLWMQSDGNLVLHDNGVAVWADGKNNGFYNRLVMQTDGNLVHYVSDGVVEWAACSTRTHGHPGSYFKLQDDGNMVLVYPGDIVGWSRFSGGACI
jgi:hypothetical protein